MKQKLIKINEQHYVIIDYSLEIKKNSYFFANQSLRYCIRVDKDTTCPFITLNKNGQEEGHFHTWKGIVIYSTLPLTHPNCCISKDSGITKGNQGCAYRNGCLDDSVPLIALEEIEEAINGYSLIDNAQEVANLLYDSERHKDSSIKGLFSVAYQEGFKAHQELNKDKLFTITDMIRAMRYASEITNNKLNNIKNYIEALLPKTEWDVEIIDGKIKIL